MTDGQPKPKRTAAGLARHAEKFMQARKFDVCLYVCDLAVAEDASDPLPYYVRGRCLWTVGRLEEALAPLARATELRPENADFEAAYAQALDDANHLAAAYEHYTRAMALNPDLFELLVGRANVRQRLGDFAGALADLDAYLARRPRSADALVLRGCCHLVAGRREQARGDFDRAIALEPGQRERVERLTGGL
jgi:tetratricopeptide (TPR) repeat protein